MHFLFSAFFPPSSFLFLCFFFVLFLSCFFDCMKKSTENIEKNQCRQWIRNRQSLSGLMPPSSFGSWSQQVLQSKSQTSCQLSLPHNVSSIGAPEYYVLTQVPVSTQSKATFSSVESDTQGPWRHALVRFSWIKSEQSKMKNRRLMSFHTKPAIPILFFIEKTKMGFCSRLMFQTFHFRAR